VTQKFPLWDKLLYDHHYRGQKFRRVTYLNHDAVKAIADELNLDDEKRTYLLWRLNELSTNYVPRKSGPDSVTEVEVLNLAVRIKTSLADLIALTKDDAFGLANEHLIFSGIAKLSDTKIDRYTITVAPFWIEAAPPKPRSLRRTTLLNKSQQWHQYLSQVLDIMKSASMSRAQQSELLKVRERDILGKWDIAAIELPKLHQELTGKTKRASTVFDKAQNTGKIKFVNDCLKAMQFSQLSPETIRGYMKDAAKGVKSRTALKRKAKALRTKFRPRRVQLSNAEDI